MFSGYGETKAQFMVSRALLEILSHRKSIGVVILCICKASCCICLQFYLILFIAWVRRWWSWWVRFI